MPFTAGSTPFGTYDSDAQFAADADRVYTYVIRKLGYGEVEVELSSSHIYAAFEEAALEFSAIVNQYQAKSVISSLLGTATGSLSGSENRYPGHMIEFQRRMAEPYGQDAGAGGNYTLYSGSFETTVGGQKYNLQSYVNHTGSDGQQQRIRIKEIFHYSPLSAYRMFGTTSAVNYLNSQLQFESFTPETIFYLLPIWEDVLRGMQFETSNRVRRSQYSFEINNNVLTLYPAPTEENRVYFTYYLPQDPYNRDFSDPQVNGVANLSNIPFGHIAYSKVNSIGKQWIWKMTLALAKEVLGQIRGKMQSIPIPDGDLSLNGPELINDGRTDQEQLRNELRQLLEDMTYDKLAAREAEIAENVERSIMKIPMGIYVG